jgi:hypothetical protein
MSSNLMQIFLLSRHHLASSGPHLPVCLAALEGHPNEEKAARPIRYPPALMAVIAPGSTDAIIGAVVRAVIDTNGIL